MCEENSAHGHFTNVDVVQVQPTHGFHEALGRDEERLEVAQQEQVCVGGKRGRIQERLVWKGVGMPSAGDAG